MKKIKKDTQVVVKHILGETAKVLVTRLDNGKYRFNCDAFASGEYCKGGFFHLRQAREVIPGKKLGNNIRFWPRLRRALHEAGVEPINIPGGEYPIHYCDEIVVPDYAVSGAHYFVIKRSDIGKYLSKLPLDDAGKARAKDIARKEAEASIEAYRQAHDPKCIATRICEALRSCRMDGEFKKITLLADDNSEFSVIYPSYKTNLIWPQCCDIAKVVCTAPETGIEFLSGYTAGQLDPRKHNRIRKMRFSTWSSCSAYLMPNPNLATEIRVHPNWVMLFNGMDAVSPELIASAKKVMLEFYDLNDNLLKERYVYDRDSEEVTKEYLCNWPFDYDGKVVGKLDWRTEKEE